MTSRRRLFSPLGLLVIFAIVAGMQTCTNSGGTLAGAAHDWGVEQGIFEAPKPTSRRRLYAPLIAP